MLEAADQRMTDFRSGNSQKLIIKGVVVDLLTIDEVATFARQSPNTLRYWRHIGKGPRSARIGSRIMYRRQDVIDWVNEAFERGAA